MAKVKAEKAAIEKAFNQFDFNGNGILSLAEIDKAIIEVLPQFAKDKPAIMRAYKAADASKDGFISKAEFHNLVELLYYYDDLYQKFEELDKDADRRITFAEFKKGHDLIGIKGKTDKELKAEFDKIDTNGGGMILFEEFTIYMAKKHVK